MNYTKEDYTKNVKPFFDKLYKLGDLSTAEEIMMGDFILHLTEIEFDFDELKKELGNLTNLKKKFFEDRGMKDELEMAQKFLGN